MHLLNRPVPAASACTPSPLEPIWHQTCVRTRELSLTFPKSAPTFVVMYTPGVGMWLVLEGVSVSFFSRSELFCSRSSVFSPFIASHHHVCTPQPTCLIAVQRENSFTCHFSTSSCPSASLPCHCTTTCSPCVPSISILIFLSIA